MPTPVLSDEVKQEALDAFNKYGSKKAAAEALGLNYNTFHHRLRLAQLDPAMQSAMAAIGTKMMPSHAWLKSTKPDGDGLTYSVFLRPDKGGPSVEDMAEAIADAMGGVAPPPFVPAPQADDNLAAVFPVADLHIGMLAEGEEVGENWDIKIATKVFSETFGRIVAVTPSAGTAVLAQLGDLMHVDDQRNVTPQSQHQLDADTRYFKILRCAVQAMKWAIEELRRKYPRVIYRGVRGNHDLTAHHAVTLALAEHYKDTPEVEIIQSAGDFYVHEFGVNMVVLHHGDRAKPDRLVHFAAAEWPEIWGRTRHRIALSGHVHHEVRKEIGGMAFESIGTIIPRDAYAYSHAYSARRALVSIVLDKTQGEITRARVGL